MGRLIDSETSSKITVGILMIHLQTVKDNISNSELKHFTRGRMQETTRKDVRFYDKIILVKILFYNDQ